MISTLYFAVPIIIGAAIGYIFAWPVCLAISVIIVAVAGWALWATKDAEIGAIVGVIYAYVAALVLFGMWPTVAIVNGISLHIDLSWLFR